MAGQGDSFKKVQQGDQLRIAHETWNTVMDMAQVFKAHQRSSTTGPIGLPDLPPGLIYVQNNTGSDLDRFSVVGLDVPIVLHSDDADKFLEVPAFSGVTPTVASHKNKFAVLTQPASMTSVAVGVAAGVVMVQLNVLDAGHTWADVDDTHTADLKTSASPAGAQILWKESGTGTGIWSIIRIGGGSGESTLWGKVSVIWSPGTGVITLTPCSGSGVPTGAADITANPEFGAAAQYCGYQVGDIVPYYDQKGDGTLFVLRTNKLPTIAATYGSWYFNGTAVFADTLRAI